MRNLLNQAYLMEREDLVKSMYALGYLKVIESAIEKATTLLGNSATPKASQQLYRDVIE